MLINRRLAAAYQSGLSSAPSGLAPQPHALDSPIANRGKDMATGLVHDVQMLIAFGLPYHHIQRQKDEATSRLPGMQHRRIRHGWYRDFGKLWNLDNPFPDSIKDRTTTIVRLKGAIRAEEYMAWVSHDFLDKIWDFDGLTRQQRAYTRKWWQGFHIWLILRPDVLRDWAGVDVLAGKIHRVIDGSEVWEDEPEVIWEYQNLYNRACFVLRRDREIRRVIEENGGVSFMRRAAVGGQA